MNKKKDTTINTQHEVNLKLFLQKVYTNKWLFIVSICSCVTIAILYILLTTPKYEVSTSILIDPSGNNRVLGESKYVEGGVGLIEMEKNLYNEIGIIKSFNLINQTVQDLGFNVSYYGENWIKNREHYGYFPFNVTLLESEAQLFDVPFEIEILANERYRLSIDANKFMVSNPSNETTHEVNYDLDYSEIFSFGDTVENDYFNFIIKRPDYKVNANDFRNLDLSFIIHDHDEVSNSRMDGLEVNNIDIQASIFKIVSNGTLVEKEIDFLRKLTENYIQNKLVSRNKIGTSKESFIRKQLDVISDSLLKAELNLELFKRDQNAVNLGATATNALGQTQNLQVENAKIGMNIKYYNSLIQYVENNRNSDDFVIPTAVGIDNAIITQNIVELTRLHAERSKKKFFVTNDNQEMSILNAQIEESTELLLNNLRSTINSSEFELRGIRSQLANYSGVINTLPLREKQLLSIQRQSTLYENLFKYLSQELAKTGIARAENTSDTRILDDPRMVGDKPVAPQKSLLLVLAVIVGTFVPLTKTVFFTPDDYIDNVNQIWANSVIPLIGSIAHRNTNSKQSKSDLSLWKIKEDFRHLAVNLNIISSKKKCTVLGITSILPEEGKTFCSINLGIALAEVGKKTLIIDTDLRSPSLVKNTDKIKGKGLSDYLQGDVKSLDTIIHKYEKLSDLDFVPTVMVDDNVHGLLSGEKMNSLILELKERYDYIILDTPPTGPVSDYILLSAFANINLFVVRRKIAKTSFLEEFKKLLLHDKKKKSYIIFNDASDKDFNYGYGDKYGASKNPRIIDDYLLV